MALLNEASDAKKLDTRLIERNINRGLLTQAELAQSISSLPDDGENAEWVDLASLSSDPSQE